MFETAPVSTNPATPILNSLLLELTDRTLLIPSVALAEVINRCPLEPRPGMPAWYLGEIIWRDLRVPLISFESLSSGVPPEDDPEGARIAVFNALGEYADFRFLALRLKSIPSPVKIEQNLPSAGEPLLPLELDSVYIGDDLMKIPDMRAVEHKLEEIGVV